MPIDAWLTCLLVFMIAASVVALEIKDVLSSIVAVGVVGLAVSISFLFLQAPDLAIVQFLFEIFALILLVRAFLRKDVHVQAPTPASRWLLGFTVLGLAAVLVLSIRVFSLLPKFGEPLMTVSGHYLASGAAETGAANLVSAIVLDYRAYDTLGEVTVLFTAILGVLTVLRAKAGNGKGA